MATFMLEYKRQVCGGKIQKLLRFASEEKTSNYTHHCTRGALSLAAAPDAVCCDWFTQPTRRAVIGSRNQRGAVIGCSDDKLLAGAESAVGALVEVWGAATGGGEGLRGAGEGLLREDGAVAAQEGELGRLHQSSYLVSKRHADVEQLAVVVDVSVVAVRQVLAVEALL